MICLEENCFGLRHVGLVRLMYDTTFVQMYGVGDGVVDNDSEGDSDGIDVDNESDGDTSSDGASEVDASFNENNKGDDDSSFIAILLCIYTYIYKSIVKSKIVK